MLHIRVPLVAPLDAGHMAQSCAEKHYGRVVVQESSHHTRTTAHILAEQLNYIVGS